MDLLIDIYFSIKRFFYRPFSTPSGPTVMVDIDDTLIWWDTPEGMEDKRIKINCAGAISRRVPNMYNVDLVKKLYESGHIVILWSASGVRWSKSVAKALKIKKYVHGYISKPCYFIDDVKDPRRWMGKHGYFDINGIKHGHHGVEQLGENKDEQENSNRVSRR
jgi:hypothetical protein